MKNLIEKVKNDKKVLIIVIVAFVLIIAGAILVFSNDGGTSTNGTNTPSTDNKALTKEEATNIIKEIFNGDNYKFNCEKIEGGNYKVTVTNTLNGKNYYYFVDATTKTYVLKTD